MPRTLVISDLHIGGRAAVSVLERPAPLERLLAELERVDRLVLLGDVVELIETRPTAAMEAATPILRAIGARLRREVPVVFVPGNHDRSLVRPWIRAQGPALTPDARVPATASLSLERLVGLLAPASVEVRYPGLWLADGVFATHGHYLDRHLTPVSTWGLLRGRRAQGRGTAPVSVYDYERSGRIHFSPAARRLPRPLAGALEDLGDLVRAATMPGVRHGVLHPRLAPLIAGVLGHQVHRHALPALDLVVRRLGLAPEFVLFGHVHRLGPLPGDAPGPWQPTPGGPQFANTGSWLYEPLLVHRAAPPHPYWPGGAIVLEDGRPPRATGLLDGLAGGDLH